MHRVRAAQAVAADLRKADGPDLTLLDEARESADAVFYRHLRIDAMQVVQVNDIGVQAPQAVLAGLRQYLGTAVEISLFVILAPRIAALARQYIFVSAVGEVLADKVLSVEEAITAVQRGIEERTSGGLVDTWPVAAGGIHATEPDGGDSEGAELSLLHFESLWSRLPNDNQNSVQVRLVDAVEGQLVAIQGNDQHPAFAPAHLDRTRDRSRARTSRV